MNIEALNKTIALMEKDVSETGIDFNLEEWIVTREDVENGLKETLSQFEDHLCGTVACIAGYVVLAHGGKDEPGIGGKAAKILQSSEIFLSSLFNPGHLLPDRKDYSSVTKEDGIKMLKHLRDTGRVDWSVIREEG